MGQAVDAVVRDTVLRFSQRHISNEDNSADAKLRHASNDACGVEYSVTYNRAAGSADGAIAIRTEWPKMLAYNLALQNIMPRVVAAGPPGVELISASSRTAIVAWLLTRKHKQVDDTVVAAAEWLASLRYLVLTDSLRHSVKQVLSPNATSVAQHALAPDMVVLSAEQQGSLLIAIPVSCLVLEDEPVFQAILQAHIEEANKVPQGPRLRFCEREEPPIDAAGFPAVERQAELGYLALTLQPRHLQPPQLERSLQCIVFFPDMLQRRLAYCRLLVRHEANAKLRQLQAELAYDEGAVGAAP